MVSYLPKKNYYDVPYLTRFSVALLKKLFQCHQLITKWGGLFPPPPLLPNFIIITGLLHLCIHITLSQQNHSLKTIGGERPKGYIQYMWSYIKSLSELKNFVVS